MHMLDASCCVSMQMSDAKQEYTINAMKDGWAAELKRQREAWAAAEKIKREAWCDNKTSEIKEMTVKVSTPHMLHQVSQFILELWCLGSNQQRLLLRALYTK